jgi:hypothetical protein
MMQFVSSLDPNDDGSYNPLRYYADVFNFVFNGLFVLELGIRCAFLQLDLFFKLVSPPLPVALGTFAVGESRSCVFMAILTSKLPPLQRIRTVVAAILSATMEDIRPTHSHFITACPIPVG